MCGNYQKKKGKRGKLKNKRPERDEKKQSLKKGKVLEKGAGGSEGKVKGRKVRGNQEKIHGKLMS